MAIVLSSATIIAAPSEVQVETVLSATPAVVHPALAAAHLAAHAVAAAIAAVASAVVLAAAVRSEAHAVVEVSVVDHVVAAAIAEDSAVVHVVEAAIAVVEDTAMVEDADKSEHQFPDLCIRHL